jgi:hypothetical protein
MKKLVLLLSVIVLLVIATGAVSAAKPAPDTFTITGYTTLLEELEPLPNGHLQVHILAQGGGEGSAEDELCKAVYGDTCQALCLASQLQPCGVAGLINGKPIDGKFTFEEWIDVDPYTFDAKNKGTVVITALHKKGMAVANFNGTVNLVALTVSGKFKVEKEEGRGAYASLKGQGDYTGGAGNVFTVTFAAQPKD